MKSVLFALCSVLCLAVFGEEPQEVSARAELATRSAFVDYGLVVGRDPVFVPSGRVTWGGWFLDAFSVIDYTDGNGKRAGYKSRHRKTNTAVGFSHGVPLYHFGALTAEVAYMYEYAPRVSGRVCDTSYITARLALEGRWLEPSLNFERDLMADDGTYVAAELGHTFRPFDGFTIRPSVAQGFGDGKRTAGCFGSFDSAGLMDATIRADFAYAVTDWLTFSAFIAYHDFWYGDGMREAAADFNGRHGHDARTWNFSAGVGISATF